MIRQRRIVLGACIAGVVVVAVVFFSAEVSDGAVRRCSALPILSSSSTCRRCGERRCLSLRGFACAKTLHARKAGHCAA